jgi:hypothetical protein
MIPLHMWNQSRDGSQQAPCRLVRAPTLACACRASLLPLAMAQYPLGDPHAPPAADWMYRVLKMGTAREAQAREAGVAPGEQQLLQVTRRGARRGAWASTLASA